MKLGVLGTGNVGRTLAAAWAHCGHEVVVGSRTADNPDANAWAKEQHNTVHIDTFAGAAAHGRILVNATAGAASLEALATVAEHDLDGKVLVDVANPLDFSTGTLRLTVCNDDSLAESIQRAHPQARVVKALNTVNVGVMVEPAKVPGDHHVFVAGDDRAAKNDAAGLVRQLGWKPDQVLDLGGLSAARGLEMYLPLWLTLMQAGRSPDFNVEVRRA